MLEYRLHANERWLFLMYSSVISEELWHDKMMIFSLKVVMEYVRVSVMIFCIESFLSIHIKIIKYSYD